MQPSRKRRLRPAQIVPLVSFVILVVAVVGAQQTPAAPSPHLSYRLSSALVANLAQPVQPVIHETVDLRLELRQSRAHDRLLSLRNRTSWRRHQARELAAVAPAAPTGPVQSSGPVHSSGGANWYATAACESGDVWSINTGNGYWGGLQFAPSTWFAYGGGPFNGVGPFPYSAATQIAVAERVLAAQGPGAWPNCFVWS